MAIRRIRISFEVTTPESAANGDFERTGWINEKGIDIQPDADDIDEFGSELAAVVELTKKVIDRNVEFSSSEFSRRGWYTSIDARINYENGEETRYSYFLDNFNEEEEKAIFDELK